jgi:hypothetical protein
MFSCSILKVTILAKDSFHRPPEEFNGVQLTVKLRKIYMWMAAHDIFPLIVPFDLGGAVFLQTSHYNQDRRFFSVFPLLCGAGLNFSYGVGMVSNCSSFSR